ncbi:MULTISPECIES: hypothetical protein [Brenneria]|uniref:Uncharacterized protein n=1 Tax=Brenneria nigrifluens DSM 30175 = ATCC 13028 TaxID=1121120 RepID=A0A2U1UU88_9GAMM|nr:MULTISPECIES: hypothetical protein [Brenneria]EHD21797.1 hypothetical protein BrE312_2417 [Brenneria sp. EniD312]PWC25151.1 hypothetical protein DDT54_04415 [Brenneria nigrifluens DSM 30175 = ATCC 13028]QCR04907.1 hypothetical protein EH206_12380 [Brenneria nigrifluens DSM 30175 = ATCC 13028]
MKKFLEIVGNASTSVELKGRYIGHNVNAVAYVDGDNITIQLESNGSRVRGVSAITMSKEEYEDFRQPQSRKLFVRGIEMFGAEVRL